MLWVSAVDAQQPADADAPSPPAASTQAPEPPRAAPPPAAPPPTGAEASAAPPTPPAEPAPSPAPPATAPATSAAPAAPTFPTVPDAGREHPAGPPPGHAHHAPAPPAPAPPLPYAPYDWGLGIGFGFAFGGDELVTATRVDDSEASLSAGDGVQFALVVSYSPLHLGPGHWLSLGIDLGIGVKMAGLNGDNGSLDLGRFPLIPRAHALAHMGGGWHLSASAGAQYDMGVFLSGDGIFAGIDEDLGSAWGPMGELGAFYRDSEESAGYTIALRYVHMEYDSSATAGPIDASSFGLAVTAMFLL